MVIIWRAFSDFLITRVPIDEALGAIGNALTRDATLQDRTNMTAATVCELTEFCLRTTYFQYRRELREQAEGAAMGSPLSPVVANLYMEYFERIALTNAIDKPRVWVRYVDDTFVVWQHGVNKLKEFLAYINQIHTLIKFKMEVEKDGKSPFLDILVARKGSKLITTVYRKKTHTNRYLNFRSHHHPRVKTGIISCLRVRAHNICDNTTLTSEKKHLQHVFESNGYPSRTVTKVLQQSQARQQPTLDDVKTLYLPYVKGLSEQIEKAVRDLDIRMVFKSASTLRKQLVHVKTKPNPDKVKGVIYSIPCDCGKVYIGETGRTLKDRLGEHKRAVTNGNTNNAIAVHILNNNDHSIEWDEAKVVKRDQYISTRKIKESLIIRATPNNMNTDPGVHVHPVWY